jgi:hypothetical protein
MFPKGIQSTNESKENSRINKHYNPPLIVVNPIMCLAKTMSVITVLDTLAMGMSCVTTSKKQVRG